MLRYQYQLMRLNKLKKYIILLCGFMLVSCKSFVSKIDGINLERDYNDKKEYVSYYSKKLGVEEKKIYFFKDEQEVYSFLENLRKNNLTFFYGLKLNDSLYRLNSKIETNSCLGLINSIIEDKDRLGKDDVINIKFDLKLNSLENNLKENPVFKKTIAIFILSDKLGKTNLNNIKDIIKGMEKDTDYLLVSVDNYFYKQNQKTFN